MVRPDGRDLRRLTDVAGTDAHSSGCAGGDWILFSRGRRGFKDEKALDDGFGSLTARFSLCGRRVRMGVG
jgi:hypothetical protein